MIPITWAISHKFLKILMTCHSSLWTECFASTMSVLCSAMFCNVVKYTLFTVLHFRSFLPLNYIFQLEPNVCTSLFIKDISLMFFQWYIETSSIYLCTNYHSYFVYFVERKYWTRLFYNDICWYWFTGLVGWKQIIPKAMSNWQLESSWLICLGNFRLNRIQISMEHCSKLRLVPRSETDKFWGGLTTFFRISLLYNVYARHYMLQDWQLLWLRFEHCMVWDPT